MLKWNLIPQIKTYTNKWDLPIQMTFCNDESAAVLLDEERYDWEEASMNHDCQKTSRKTKKKLIIFIKLNIINLMWCFSSEVTEVAGGRLSSASLAAGATEDLLKRRFNIYKSCHFIQFRKCTNINFQEHIQYLNLAFTNFLTLWEKMSMKTVRWVKKAMASRSLAIMNST